jgi:hypothetical protein
MDVKEEVTVDLDEKGHIVGIEILDASKKLQLSELMGNSMRLSIGGGPPQTNQGQARAENGRRAAGEESSH